MKRTILLAACAAAVAVAASAAPKAKAPPPAPPAPAKAAGPSAPGPGDWRSPEPNDVLVIDTNKGRVIVEMIPEVAPRRRARSARSLTRNFYDGDRRFFRVIDKFMDQTGDPQNNGQGRSSKPNIPAEFTFRRGPDLPFVMAADQTVAEIGFV